MNILYAIQATGNGHLARASEIIPGLSKHGFLDILVSGIQGDLSLPLTPSYTRHGLSFIFGKSGQVDIWKTMQSLRPRRLWRDIRELPIEKYDLVVHDFEPVTAHACRIKKIPNISVSHQASFYYAETPRPSKKNPFAEWILRHYAPSEKYVGLHFESYHPGIFTPIIRREIRALKTETSDHGIIYLPAYCPHYLAAIFAQIPTIQWKIFSKHSRVYQCRKNIEIFPVSSETWLEALRTAKAVICGAGFEGPSEALYLGKKLLVVPMKNQYEQQCNAAALRKLNITCLEEISTRQIDFLRKWLCETEAQQIQYPDNASDIIGQILQVC